VSGLGCDQTATVSVDAVDAAGNHSARTSTSARSGACPDGSDAAYVSPPDSDTNDCRAAAKACRNLDRAYRVVLPGQTVEPATGSYGSQTLQVDPSKTSSSDVVFQPAAGATPRLTS
jgi:hypothetical protein